MTTSTINPAIPAEGSQVASEPIRDNFQAAVNDIDALWAAISGSGGTALLVANNLSDVADAATSRTNLGLGTAAVRNIGASGANVPLLNGTNVWSGNQSISSAQPTFVWSDSGSTFTSQIDNLNGKWRFLQRDKTSGTYTNSLLFDDDAIPTFAQPPIFASGPLALTQGGTGATSASAARTSLGLGTAAILNSSAVALTANNLSDLSNAGTARTNLGLGTLATLSSVNNANWSGTDLALANGGTGASDATGARTNLGLGTAATLAASDVAQTANNLSDLASVSSARTNLGLGTAATFASTSFLQTGNNLSDLANAATARTNLGLGTSAVVNTGTGGATIPLLNGTNTWSADQVLSTGAQLTITGTPATNEVGFLGTPQIIKVASYTGTMGDAGHEIMFAANATYTIPANASVAFPIGTTIELSANVGVTLNIAITSDTLRWIPTSATGTRALGGPGTCVIQKKSATEWWISGVGVG